MARNALLLAMKQKTKPRESISSLPSKPRSGTASSDSLNPPLGPPQVSPPHEPPSRPRLRWAPEVWALSAMQGALSAPSPPVSTAIPVPRAVQCLESWNHWKTRTEFWNLVHLCLWFRTKLRCFFCPPPTFHFNVIKTQTKTPTSHHKFDYLRHKAVCK